MSIERIISGGQTGADRGALDAAIALDIDHGGWCPKGRRAEDGVIPQCYWLNETLSGDYPPRTRLNVELADATVIIVARGLTPGSRLTVDVCREIARPYVVLTNAITHTHVAAAKLSVWLAKVRPRVLNVAGNRESRAPGIAGAAKKIITLALESIR